MAELSVVLIILALIGGIILKIKLGKKLFRFLFKPRNKSRKLRCPQCNGLIEGLDIVGIGANAKARAQKAGAKLTIQCPTCTNTFSLPVASLL
jgi:hypothetical protein